MGKLKNITVDPLVTSTRPDLEVNVPMPGAYVIKDGQKVPDLNDEAMRLRHQKPEEVKEEAPEASEAKADENN